MIKVLLATNSTDRGSTSRTLEAWVRLFPPLGIDPVVSVGGPGPLLDALRQAGVECSARTLHVIPSKAWPFPYLRAVLSLVAAIRLSGARLVHVNEHDSHIVASRAARLAGVPIVTHLRFRPEPGYCGWLFKPPYAPARLICTSAVQMNDSAAALEPFVPRDRWRLIPNGLDFDRFGKRGDAREPLRREWGAGERDVVLGVACAIAPHKRIDHFVRVVHRLRAEGLPVRGIVAGKAHRPEYEALVDELKRLARDLGVGEALRFIGYVEPSEPLYHAWDVCVSTSAYETFGMTVLEALACRCATVAYASGAIPEVAGDAALLVPDGDEQALLAACRTAAADGARRRALAEAGYERARTFDVRRATARLADEYRSVLGAA